MDNGARILQSTGDLNEIHLLPVNQEFSRSNRDDSKADLTAASKAFRY